tara:strand:+ start:65 stop:673 length:609 start_codon:yes stop_codon:yes gene_type:complete
MYVKWIFRAWPFLVTALIIITHQYTSTLPCYFQWLCFSNQVIDKYLSFALNISGGLLVIYSIDSNLGLFKKGNLYTLFAKWVKSFPLVKGEPLSIVAEPGKYTVTAHPARIELTKPPESIEELYRYTQEQVSLLRKDLKNERRSRDEALGKMANEWSTKHSAINKNVTEINDLLKAVAIGGIKLQIFGVLLVTYGSYIGLSA